MEEQIELNSEQLKAIEIEDKLPELAELNRQIGREKRIKEVIEDINSIDYSDFQKAKSKKEYEQLYLIRMEIRSLLAKREKDLVTERIVNFIKRMERIYTTRDDVKSEIWIYEGGIYKPQGRTYIKEYCRKLLDEHFTSSLYNEVVNKIEADTYINSEDFFKEGCINELPIQDGILNIITREVKPFTPDKIFFNKLPVSYNPIAKCEQIDKFLSEILKSKDDKNVFYEIGGFCLLKEYKFEKAFMFVGNGRNGKDKSLELIKRLLGIENCCSVPLSSIIPDSFVLSEFYNKMANLAGELNNHDLKDTSMFKAFTGRSLQSAPRKFLKPITFVNHAKFIFACNELPMVYDNSRGFWDRWVLLEFPYTFVTSEELNNATDKNNLKLRDECIIEKITTPEELSGLLNEFLNGLDRLNKNKQFSNTLGSSEIKSFWIRKSNSVMAFCLQMVEDSYDSYITKKEFRKKYSSYCKEFKLSPKSDFVIKRTIEEIFGATEGNRGVDTKWEKVWEGIKWKGI